MIDFLKCAFDFCCTSSQKTAPLNKFSLGSGEHCKLPQRVQAEPGQQTILGKFEVKIKHPSTPFLFGCLANTVSVV